jgi:aspartyl-tRNA(Asn)/glutamyl-tRNA(Gln) amidotransferase subunit C
MAKKQIDDAAVKRIAHLARLQISDQEVQRFGRELNGILAFVEELNAIDTSKVEPLTHAGDAQLRMRTDVVTDGGRPGDIIKNAPKTEDGFFLVPKVIE